jgi:hypothetical protein
MINRLYKPLLAVLFLSAMFHNAEIFAMSILKGEKVCIFSGFEGRLTYKGEPAAGARIVRHVNWKDQKGESDETVTDENGRFSFPAKWATLRQVLPSQFTANQNITVHYSDQEFLIWTSVKLRKDEYSEFGGQPVDLRCEISQELERVESNNPRSEVVGTNCRWEIK